MSYNWDYLDKLSYNNRVGHYKFKQEYEFIINNSNNKYHNILDIAGGSGRFAIPLFKYSRKITVIDINQSAIDLLESRENEINTICKDFYDYEFQEKYTLILCIEALGYFNDLSLFFKKVNAVIENDGRFIFTHHNPGSWRFLLRKIWCWRNGGYPYNDIKINDLITIIQKNDFKIENIQGMNWIPLPLKSNSILVPIFEKIERTLKLRTWISQSPLLLIAVKKVTNNCK